MKKYIYINLFLKSSRLWLSGTVFKMLKIVQGSGWTSERKRRGSLRGAITGNLPLLMSGKYTT